MQIARTQSELNQALQKFRSQKKRIGFIPTMGGLHAGHLSLVRQAKKQTQAAVVSIFVNPTQFGPHEDFKKYPRRERQDLRLLKSVKTDVVFIPSVKEIYPKKKIAFIQPGHFAQGLCGAKRQGHFRGVVTVVHRLFEMVKPNAAFFGQKDFQQFKVIEDLVRRKKLKIKLAMCPIIREADGLAMSSRNQYLSKQDRLRAKQLFVTLTLADKAIRLGWRQTSELQLMLKAYLSCFVDQIDYVAIVDPERLKAVRTVKKTVLVALAAFIGNTRLIDNLVIQV